MQENKKLVDGKWEDAEELEFSYPQCIKMIPIKRIREIVEDWYWQHGEWLEWKIEELKDKFNRKAM